MRALYRHSTTARFLLHMFKRTESRGRVNVFSGRAGARGKSRAGRRGGEWTSRAIGHLQRGGALRMPLPGNPSTVLRAPSTMMRTRSKLLGAQSCVLRPPITVNGGQLQNLAVHFQDFEGPTGERNSEANPAWFDSSVPRALCGPRLSRRRSHGHFVDIDTSSVRPTATLLTSIKAPSLPRALCGPRLSRRRSHGHFIALDKASVAPTVALLASTKAPSVPRALC